MKKLLILSGLFLALVLVLGGCTLGAKVLKPEDAKAKALDYINKNLVSAESQVTIEDIKQEGGIYKMSVKLQDGTTVDSYMTLDGQTFFPQGMATDPKDATNTNTNTANTQPSAEVTTKSDKPVVELFVMSHCPYGTQIEKGLLPVLDLLKEKIAFSLKFCDYAMHGKKELDEELAQTCIQKEQVALLQPYLKCFLASSDSAKCLDEVKVNKTKLNSCVAATDKEFKVTANFDSKTDWKGQFPPFAVFAAENQKYGIQGSPSIVINGQQISSGRDPQSLLNVICSAFNTSPEECSKQLDAATPDPGFGTGTGSASSTDAGCATQ